MNELDPADPPVDPIVDPAPPADPPSSPPADPKSADPPPAATPGDHENPPADPPADDKDKDSGSAIPENWRDLAADGDEDTLKLLKRYGSLKGVAKALKQAQATISSGKLKKDMPDAKKDPDAYKEWLKSEGVPDDPTGYKLPETVTKRMTDEDKPLITSFTEFAHAKGARPDVVEIASEWYFDSVEAIEAERAAEDAKAKEDAEEALRTTWGNAEYKGNLTLADRWVQQIPGLEAGLDKIRAADGRVLGAIPEFVEWASDQGRAMFGDSTFATPDGERQHMSRRAEIEKIRDTDFDRYEREGLDKELMQLTDKDLKRGKR